MHFTGTKIFDQDSAVVKVQGMFSSHGRLLTNAMYLDLVNINAYIKFAKILSIYSQDIELKRNSGVNQGP